ncbi:TPA: hypothetical protein ACKJ67_002185, partial [Neisseria gonorrhoeae]
EKQFIKKEKGGIRKDWVTHPIFTNTPFSFFPPYFPARTTPERSDSGLRYAQKKTAILAVNPLRSAQAILRGSG